MHEGQTSLAIANSRQQPFLFSYRSLARIGMLVLILIDIVQQVVGSLRALTGHFRARKTALLRDTAAVLCVIVRATMITDAAHALPMRYHATVISDGLIVAAAQEVYQLTTLHDGTAGATLGQLVIRLRPSRNDTSARPHDRT